jgi:hypothetical protein
MPRRSPRSELREQIRKREEADPKYVEHMKRVEQWNELRKRWEELDPVGEKDRVKWNRSVARYCYAQATVGKTTFQPYYAFEDPAKGREPDLTFICDLGPSDVNPFKYYPVDDPPLFGLLSADDWVECSQVARQVADLVLADSALEKESGANVDEWMQRSASALRRAEQDHVTFGYPVLGRASDNLLPEVEARLDRCLHCWYLADRSQHCRYRLEAVSCQKFRYDHDPPPGMDKWPNRWLE